MLHSQVHGVMHALGPKLGLDLAGWHACVPLEGPLLNFAHHEVRPVHRTMNCPRPVAEDGLHG
eukprot:4296266-Pyramimonas_sp.AAC.1